MYCILRRIYFIDKSIQIMVASLTYEMHSLFIRTFLLYLVKAFKLLHIKTL
jgi:hypothetical protein